MPGAATADGHQPINLGGLGIVRKMIAMPVVQGDTHGTVTIEMITTATGIETEIETEIEQMIETETETETQIEIEIEIVIGTETGVETGAGRHHNQLVEARRGKAGPHIRLMMTWTLINLWSLLMAPNTLIPQRRTNPKNPR